MKAVKTIVGMLSGGVASWLALKQGFAAYPQAVHRAVFTDTLAEDSDLYRVLVEGACNLFEVEVPAPLLTFLEELPEYHENLEKRRQMLGHVRDEMRRLVPGLAWLCDGRDPWAVFHDVRFIGNTRHDPCSACLKRILADQWLEQNCDRSETVVVVGIDWSENHRFYGRWVNGEYQPGLQARRAAEGWTYAAPLCHGHRLTKTDMLAALEREGIDRSHLYELGFRHDNCGGFCVKAGHGQFAHLLTHLPDRYEFHEYKEAEARRFLGRDDVTILRLRRNRKFIPITLAEFRVMVEAEGTGAFQGWGGCGCMVDGDANAIRTVTP